MSSGHYRMSLSPLPVLGCFALMKREGDDMNKSSYVKCNGFQNVHHTCMFWQNILCDEFADI